MKRLILIAQMICLLAAAADAQPGGTVRLYWNNHLLLQRSNISSPDTPVVVVKKIWLTQKGTIRILFNKATKRQGWKRVFQFTDIVNNIIFQKDFNYTTGNYMFSTTALKPFLQKHGRLLVYSFQQPPENGLLSGIRTERYLLGKLIVD